MFNNTNFPSKHTKVFKHSYQTYKHQTNLTLSLGQATVVPRASDMNSTSAFGLQTLASPIFATKTKTLQAFSPNWTKWTLSSGFVEITRPSATVFPELSQSNKRHFFSGLDLAVSKLLVTLCHQKWKTKHKYKFNNSTIENGHEFYPR